jgi:threonine dehydrogenase-like Zn-dependent dehydrogenase
LRAITVAPGGGPASVKDVPEPSPSQGAVLVRTIALGVCATDREIVAGHYGTAPAGEDWLILGHESLGRVQSAPPSSGLQPGDLVAGIVRRPDPAPCPACAAGQWDMCYNGGYNERGIKGLHGFGSEFFRVEEGFAVKLDPALGRLGVLLEPASILAKAWEEIGLFEQRAPPRQRRTVLVTGAGPIGLIAALMGTQRNFDVHVLDRPGGGVKPALVRDLGAGWHDGHVRDTVECLTPDIVIECTAAPAVVRDLLGRTAATGIICLTGVSVPGARLDADLGWLNRTMVLHNQVVFGTVNANRRHYEQAACALARADRRWLERLITRRVPLDRWREAMDVRPDDVKAIVEFDGE